MMENILKTMDTFNSASYQFNEFMSAFAWSSNSTLIDSYLSPHAHFLFQNLSFIML